jgi:hypothetical protein
MKAHTLQFVEVFELTIALYLPAKQLMQLDCATLDV